MTSEASTNDAKHDLTEPTNYGAMLLLGRDSEGLKKYETYLRQHNARLRRLEREARGEQVPGDYDGGYR